ncbi:MAG: hypothetical protein O6922_00010 [Chloroflexi bacterium]|nr:hypothetical protein [Chloroflexota bacterium]
MRYPGDQHQNRPVPDAKIVRHGRYVIFQMAEVAIPGDLFGDIPHRIDRLRPKPAPT